MIPSMFGITRMKFLFIIIPITLLLIYVFVTFVKILLDSQEDLYDTQADRDRYKKTLAPMLLKPKLVPVIDLELPDDHSNERSSKQREISKAFLHAWKSYKRYAWGHDELKPVSKGWIDWMGLGLTIVDSLDTLWIMGLKDEFRIARNWVADNLTFARDANLQLFEVVIRELGGLLSAYHLSGDQVFLTKAIQLGNALLPCLKLENGIPCTRINLRHGFPTFGSISTAEVGSIELELRELSRSSNIAVFEKVAQDITSHLHRMRKLDSLVPAFINPNGNFMRTASITVGSSADSYYEYLLKQWIQTGKKHDWLRNDYLKAVDGIKKHLLRFTPRSGLAYVGSYSDWYSRHFRTVMDHLACFFPGTLALGVLHGLDPSHLNLAENLTKTCYRMYEKSELRLAPEAVSFGTQSYHQDFQFILAAAQNVLRPETVESLFYMYLATQDEKYRQWGWQIFKAFEQHSRVEGGYAGISNVLAKTPSHVDKMESFFLAETLKYLYLLFSDSRDVLSIKQTHFVFNTEAHLLPIHDS